MNSPSYGSNSNFDNRYTLLSAGKVCVQYVLFTSQFFSVINVQDNLNASANQFLCWLRLKQQISSVQKVPEQPHLSVFMIAKTTNPVNSEPKTWLSAVSTYDTLAH